MDAVALLQRYIQPGDGSVSATELCQVLGAAGVQVSDAGVRALVRELAPDARTCGYDPSRIDGVEWTFAGRRARDWEWRLRSEGLGLERGQRSDTAATDPDVLARMPDDGPLGAAREYLSAAETHLLEWPWQSPRERGIWALHVSGVTNRAIGRRYGMRHQSVGRVVNRHRRHCGLRSVGTGTYRPARNVTAAQAARRTVAREYAQGATWSTANERRAWMLVEVERWPYAMAASELGLTPRWVEQAVRRHRERAGLS